jgi:predicted nucleic acid-binding protein
LSTRIVYLDTSVIVKRYVLEHGSEIVEALYSNAWNDDVEISFSIWSIVDVLGILDKYHQGRLLEDNEYKTIYCQQLKHCITL